MSKEFVLNLGWIAAAALLAARRLAAVVPRALRGPPGVPLRFCCGDAASVREV